MSVGDLFAIPNVDTKSVLTVTDDRSDVRNTRAYYFASSTPASGAVRVPRFSGEES